MIALRVTVPIACFRRPFSREWLESEELPPPSTCYGFLLSMVGEPLRKTHVGARVCPALLSKPERSSVLRKIRRFKEKDYNHPRNSIPDFQELVTGVYLVIWLDSSGEKNKPTLEDRVRVALYEPHKIQRSGGLSLGESTHLVDEVSEAKNIWPDWSPLAYVLQEEGRLTLPVWADHVSNLKSRFVVGDLVSLTSPPTPEMMPQIVP